MRDEIQRICTAAWGDLRRAWKQLLAIKIAFKVASFALLVPISGLALRAFLFTQGSRVITDKEIVSVVLSPVGLIGLVVLAAIAVAIVALEVACMMTVGLARPAIRLTDSLRFVAGKSLATLKLAIRLVGTALLFAAPFLAAAALVFVALLTEFDINFYLAERPPAFWLAAVLIGAISGVGLIVLVPRLLAWSYALPLVLFEDTPPSRAPRASAERARGRRPLLATLLVGWAVASTLAAALAFGGVRLLATWLAPTLRDGRPGLLLTAIAALVILWVLVNEVVTLVTVSAFALVVGRAYERVADEGPLGEWRSSVAGLERAGAWRVKTWHALAAVAAAGVAAALLGTALLDRLRTDSDARIIAHRGAAIAAPENTLAAIERAIEDGADSIEIDVLETADGEVAVVHDRDLMRVGGVNLAIADTPWEELARVDVGSWFGPEFSDQRVPLLADVLELCRGRAEVTIELKYFGRSVRLEERVVEIVETAGMESEIVVMSLEYPAVQKMRSLRPDWRLGLITAVAIGNLTTVDADFLAVNGNLATPLFLRNAHAAGKDVYVWPIYDRIEKARFIGRGADGLITNDPALGRAVLAELAELTPPERLLIDVALWMGIVPEQARHTDLESQRERI